MAFGRNHHFIDDRLKATSLNVSWTNCGKSNDKGNVSQVIFKPNPPIINQNWTITGVGTVDEDILNGSYTLSVVQKPFVNDNIKGSVCQPNSIKLPAGLGDIYYNGIPCPIKQGELTLTMTAYVSTLAPSGTVLSTLTIYDGAQENGNQVVCVAITAVIS